MVRGSEMVRAEIKKGSGRSPRLRNGPGEAQKGTEMVRAELQKAQKWSGLAQKGSERFGAQKWSGAQKWRSPDRLEPLEDGPVRGH